MDADGRGSSPRPRSPTSPTPLGFAVAVAIAVTLVAGAGVPLAAHQTSPAVRTVLDRVDPPLDGVSISVRASLATELLVENPTDVELTVIGTDGRPFLRIGPGGVLANLDASDWYTTSTPEGGASVPARTTDPADEPDWVQVSTEPRWAWFDHRLHPSALVVDLPEPGEPAAETLATWTVPMRYGDDDVVVRGHLERRPILGRVEAVLIRDEPVSGVRLSVLQGRLPGLFLESGLDAPVTVLDVAGQPYARIGPDGVEVNVHSRLHHTNLQAREEVPPVTDPDAAPRWRHVADVPRHAWLEPRARYPDEQPPDDVVARAAPTTLLEWAVPVLVDGQRVAVEGTTRWVPAEQIDGHDTRGGRGPLYLGLALVAVAVAVIAARRGAS